MHKITSYREDGTCSYSLRQVLNVLGLVMVTSDAFENAVVVQTRTRPHIPEFPPVSMFDVWDALRDGGQLTLATNRLSTMGVNTTTDDPDFVPKFHDRPAFLTQTPTT